MTVIEIFDQVTIKVIYDRIIFMEELRIMHVCLSFQFVLIQYKYEVAVDLSVNRDMCFERGINQSVYIKWCSVDVVPIVISRRE